MTPAYTAALLSALVALTMLFLVRRDHLQIRRSIFWLFVAGAVLTLGLFPGLADTVAAWFGVHYSPTFVLILAVLVVMLRLLVLDIEQSQQERELRRLTQRLAIYEHLASHTRTGPSLPVPPSTEQKS